MSSSGRQRAAARSWWRRAGTWLAGYPATVIVGLVFAALFVYRSQWIGVAAMLTFTPILATAERWSNVRYPGAREAPWVRIVYALVVATPSAIYATTTRDEFFVIVFPAMEFLPAIQAIARAVGGHHDARKPT